MERLSQSILVTASTLVQGTIHDRLSSLPDMIYVLKLILGDSERWCLLGDPGYDRCTRPGISDRFACGYYYEKTDPALSLQVDLGEEIPDDVDSDWSDEHWVSFNIYSHHLLIIHQDMLNENLPTHLKGISFHICLLAVSKVHFRLGFPSKGHSDTDISTTCHRAADSDSGPKWSWWSR